MGGESQKRKQPGEKFSNISIDLGCFHLVQDGIWGQARLGSPPPPAPFPFIYGGATLPGCKPRPVALTAASPPALPPTPSILSSQLPSPQTAARQPLLLATSLPQTPSERAAILLPALSCSALPFLPAPKCIALKSLHRAGGGKRAGCRQGTRLPVLAAQALAGTALRASSTRWSQRLNEINKAGSQPLLR